MFVYIFQFISFLFNLLVWVYSPKPGEAPSDKSDDITWQDDTSTVALKDEATFYSTLKKKRHAIVMFYAPCMSTFSYYTILT